MNEQNLVFKPLSFDELMDEKLKFKCDDIPTITSLIHEINRASKELKKYGIMVDSNVILKENLQIPVC